MVRRTIFAFTAIALSAFSYGSSGQEYSTEELAALLLDGGYIIFMRHANAPGELPTPDTAAPGNDRLERQLDEKGRADARNFGEAIRRLGIPVSSVERSPTFRTRQTAEYAGFEDVIVRDFLLEEGMVGVTPERLETLLAELEQKPVSGNRLFISHSGNIMASFPNLDPYIAQGEALIIDPAREQNKLLGRIQISQWQDL